LRIPLRSFAFKLFSVTLDLQPKQTKEAQASPRVPKDAAAIILIRPGTDPRDPEIYWVKRSTKLAFLGGFYAFPGGQRENSDDESRVENSTDAETAAMISCAARELFEETGVLLARGAQTLTVGQRASLLDDLGSKRLSWPELLNLYGLHLDAADFTFVGRWVTPPFAPRRFDTWFFLANSPEKQQPNITEDSELESGEWIRARAAYAKWERSEIIVVPPVLHAVKVLAGGLTDDLVERFLSVPQARREPTRRIEFHPHYICFPVRTPTKPPATHTNCYLIHSLREILVIDPGSPYPDEQQALADCLDDLLSAGSTVREIILTHVHPDHVAGVNALNDHLQKKCGRPAPVAAHRLTAESLKDQVRVDRHIEDDEVIELNGEPAIKLRSLYTPGHARGHLCFYDERTGALISGDNIVGFGSVLIDPPEGNMREYLESLRRMRALPNLSVLFGGHGPAIANPYEKIDEYITHRQQREELILEAVREGAMTPKEIVARAYTDVSPKAHAMAERAVMAHLEKLEADGLVTRASDDGYQARAKD
jgi:glyoxylase-like metal-dependent hydrolase (beta-lactamase superfamily II)/8-oxo-dGTP pyrophosphatase MutT (NUDIX family)